MTDAPSFKPVEATSDPMKPDPTTVSLGRSPRGCVSTLDKALVSSIVLIV